MTYINTGRTWLELQWQHVRCTEPSEGQRRWNYLVNSTTLHTRDSSHIRSHIWTEWRGLQGKGWQWKQKYIHVDNLKGLIIWNYLFGYAVTKYNPKTTLAIWYMTDCLSSFVKTSERRGCRSTHLKSQHLWGWGRSIAWPDWATYCIRESTGL